MTETNQSITDETMARLEALRASRGAAVPTGDGGATPVAEGGATTSKRSERSKRPGPAPTRILAAAASVSVGIGLVALMGGAQETVVQVNPTPVTIQPATIIVEMAPTGSTNGAGADEVRVRVVEAATPVQQIVPQARAVTQSQGS